MTAAEAMIQRAKVQRDEGDSVAAEASYYRAAKLAASGGLLRLRAHALRHAAELAAEQGRGERALKSAEEALALYQSDREARPLDIANAYRVRALARTAAGQADLAVLDWRAARAIYGELGIEAGVAECDRRTVTS